MKNFIALLLCCGIAFSITIASAAQSPTSIQIQSFPIEGIGTSSVPPGLIINSSVGTESMTNLETQYDLTFSDKGTSHYARFIVYKDTRDLGFAASLLDLVDFKPELMVLLSNMGKNAVSKKMEENGLTLIEWLPISKINILTHTGVQIGARFTLPEKFPMPMYASIVTYPQDGKLTGLALMCPDSDKTYWVPIFSQIVNTMR